MQRRRFSAVASLFVFTCAPLVSPAELPLAPDSAKGQTVTPVFEGWYRNRDGTYRLSFGYYNRNLEEVLEIPIGPDNFMLPGDADQGQPSHFQPRRHWGVFAITVPADFGAGRIEWTLRVRGETFTIPGSLNRDWEIDALKGEAGSGNSPPTLRFSDMTGGGPGGVTGATLTGSVGTPVAVSVWAEDDGKASGGVSGYGDEGTPVNLTWFKHQGPGDVHFSETVQTVDNKGDEATTMATFSVPGAYVLRVLAADASGVTTEGEPNISNAGHAQCCWTNGFVPVTVTE